MRYIGETGIVQSIEQQIRKYAICFNCKTPNYDNLFGIKSVVDVRVIEILTPKKRFFVRLFYDGRENTPPEKEAIMDVNDRDMWWLCKVAPDIIKLIALLKPHDGKGELNGCQTDVPKCVSPASNGSR
jgi:hypothetical protein